MGDNAVRRYFVIVTTCAVNCERVQSSTYHLTIKQAMRLMVIVTLHHTFARIQMMVTVYIMMTSSTANIFRVLGPLWGEPPSQKPMTRSFDVFFDLRLQMVEQTNKRRSETPPRSWWRHFNDRRTEHCFAVVRCNAIFPISFKVIVRALLPTYPCRTANGTPPANTGK